MPAASITEGRRIRPAVAGLIMLFMAGLAAAANGTKNCPGSKCNASEDEFQDDRPTLSSTVPLTSLRDTTVLRNDNPSDLDPEASEADSAVARLLERRGLERDAAEDAQSDAQGKLPGLNPEMLRLFRSRMYRTDI